MKRLLISIVVFIAGSLGLSGGLWAQPRYDLIDLGVIQGPGVNPQAMNRHGRMTGSAVLSDAEHLVLATGDGTVQDLGMLAETFSVGLGISSNQIIVGVGENATQGQAQAFIWTSATGIQALPGVTDTLHSSASGVNNAGIAVGHVDVVVDPFPVTTPYAVRWVNLVPQVLAGTPSGANTINQSGQIGGVIGSNGIIWGADGSIAETLTYPDATSSVSVLNDRGQALVSVSDTIGHLIRWQAGVSTPLAQPSDGFSESLFCGAGGMNLFGWIVGSCTRDPAIDGTSNHAFLWQATTPVDLNTLIEAPGYIVISASDINDFGMVTGQAVVGGQTHGVLLVPQALKNFPGLMDWLGL
jgi:uncharacterized membrane protein